MVRFCSSEVQEHGSVAGQILKKLGFRLDFLLTVAVKCVPATGLRTTLDPSQGPLKNVAPCFHLWRQKDCTQQSESTAEKIREAASPISSLLQPSPGVTAVSRRQLLGGFCQENWRMRTFQGREAERLFAEQRSSTNPLLVTSSFFCCSDGLGVSGLWDLSETFNAFWDTLQKCQFLSPSAL